MEPTDPTPDVTPVPAAAAPAPPAIDPAAPIEPEKPKEGLWETIRSLLVVLVAVLCMRTFVLEATVIPTGSMENTILIGDHVFLNKLLYGPHIPYTAWRLPEIRSIHRQDIVAFRYPVNPSVMFVKRVIGVGGDVIRIVDKKVYVNGVPLKEPYTSFQYSSEFMLRDNFPPPIREIDTLPAAWGLDPNWAHDMPRYIYKDGLHVPEGYLFCMGDNRDNSLDSRFWGFVPLDNVVGEPLFVYWSYDAPTREWTSEDLKDRLKFDASIVWNFISKTRWSRTGKIF
ncbi:MAG TPA: signal peptidase I [Terriglobia bacterium]|nr:signal peptidase I [Terriglobia bacterium]